MNEVQIINENMQVMPVSGSDAMLGMIERMAMTPEVDIVKLQALMEMRNQEIARVDRQEQEELARIAKREFNADYVVMSNELPTVEKTKFNKFTESKYASHDDVMDVVRPILIKYGFGITCDVVAQAKDSITLQVTLIHKGGHEKLGTPLTLPLDNMGAEGKVSKTVMHGTTSSIKYATRVAICTLLNISTGNDTDGNAPVQISYITHDEAMEIESQITELSIDRINFLKYMGVESIDKIEFRLKARAMNSLNAKRKAINEEAANA